jgi:hypothetical protein
MSASASDADRPPNDADDLTPLEESADDSRGTRMAYEEGSRTPLYVIGAWVLFMGAYVAYHLIYLVPDLRAWFQASF